MPKCADFLKLARNEILKTIENGSENDVLLSHVKQCFDVIDMAFDRYDPSKDEIAICFNGGKDCIVLLHLVDVVFKERFKKSIGEDCGKKAKLLAFYVETNPADTFNEIKQFISKTCNAYSDSLNLVQFTDVSMKEALHSLITDKTNGKLKAAFLGVREGDPSVGKVPCSDDTPFDPFFCETDTHWPSLMRVNPILKWDYGSVWTYIRLFNIPYVGLYDRGFTSLGCISKSVENRALFDEETGSFRPAHQLKDFSLERCSRLETS